MNTFWFHRVIQIRYKEGFLNGKQRETERQRDRDREAQTKRNTDQNRGHKQKTVMSMKETLKLVIQ